MTARETKELLGENYIAVILGNGISAHLSALRLYNRYRVVSVLCGRGEGPLNLLNFVCGFLQLDFRKNSRLSVEKLLDLAEYHSDCATVLFPVSKESELFISENIDALECKYIISTQADGVSHFRRVLNQHSRKGE